MTALYVWSRQRAVSDKLRINAVAAQSSVTVSLLTDGRELQISLVLRARDRRAGSQCPNSGELQLL